ncbi:NAD(P)-dependent oxidoreductase [Aquitalea sp. ASV11]|uniref:NAD(P)-dependent oxidoreductase n=1 Tax=Aquitalea sp. ASV11 TaxID=2795103 RepID=UPI0018EDD025|nr:NAD(P)-dependent oxidoreductase [Aquitalea sp. ASV11]
MKIALIGATGFVGSAVLQELLARQHQVSAIVSRPERLPAHPQLTAVKADAYDADAIAQAVAGHDMVISTFNPGWDKADIRALFLKGHAAIVAGVKQAGVKRFLEVGGAGSLYVAPGVQLIDTPHFPAEYKEGAEGARQALADLQQETVLDWVFLSPPALLAPGERSGQYRLGGDALLMDGEAPAGISVADLAVAIADEVETPRHSRQRFTVAH